MERRRATFVGGVRVCPAIGEDFREGEIPRAHRLMKRRDPIAVPGIDDRASLEEQHRDTRGLWTIRASQVCDAMEGRFAESIGRGGVCSTIEEISDDLGVE